MTVMTWRLTALATLAAAGLIVGCSKSDEATPSTAAEATAAMDTTPAPTPGASGSIYSGGVPASAPPTGVAPSTGATGSDTGYVGGATSAPVGPAAGGGDMGSTPIAPPSGGTAGRPRSSGE